MLKPLKKLTEAVEASQILNPFSLAPEAVQHRFLDEASNTLILLPSHETYYSNLVSRNFPLLKTDEQAKIRKARIGIVGQGTVGGNVALAMARYGFEDFRTCDHDSFDFHNMNRQPVDLLHLGANKAEHIAAQISRVNPFAKVEIFEPLSETNIDSFVASCDIVVSALDNVRLMILLNHSAMRQKIPVLLGTDVGSRVLMDVFDYRKNIELMNGRVSLEDLNLPYLALVMKIVGAERLPLEMLEALFLRLEGKIDYFAQTMVSANISTSLLIEATVLLLLGKTLKSSAVVDAIDSLAQTSELRQRQWEAAQAKMKTMLSAPQA